MPAPENSLDEPPPRSVGLRNLVFCHPSVSEAAATSLRLTWANVDIIDGKIVWHDRQRSGWREQEYVSEGSFSGSTVQWHTFHINDRGEPDGHHSKVTDAWSRDNPAPIYAAWCAAYSKTLDLLKSCRLRLWGRPGGSLQPGRFMPADCLPEEPNRPHFDKGTIELVDGTTVFSCHLVPFVEPTITTDLPAERTMANYALQNADRRVTNTEFRKMLKGVGISSTNFKVYKQSMRQILTREMPELAAIYAQNDPVRH